jgi:hypothetical protein
MRRALLIGSLLLLAAPAAALAGGFATTGLSSTPEGLAPGQPWKVELTVLQHGRTPLEGVSPRIVTRDADGLERSFAATATSKPGVYAATVRFPRPGQWTYTVYDGFNDGMPTTYPAVIIKSPGAATAPARRDPLGPPELPIILAGALVLGASGFVLWRRRHAGHGSARLA